MEQLSRHIIDEIKERGIVPTPRWQFMVRRSVFWSSALMSIIVGGISFSVADYIFFDNEGVSSATLLESPIEWLIHTVPFIWLVALVLFSISAYLSLRKTSTGYRYRALFAIVSVIVATFVLGLILSAFDFGQSVHTYMLGHTSLYDALIYSKDDWTLP